jgi:hypothetical protein
MDGRNVTVGSLNIKRYSISDVVSRREFEFLLGQNGFNVLSLRNQLKTSKFAPLWRWPWGFWKKASFPYIRLKSLPSSPGPAVRVLAQHQSLDKKGKVVGFSTFKVPSQDCEKRPLASSCLSVCLLPSAWNNSALVGRIFMKFDVGVFFENLSRKFTFTYNVTIITGTLHEDLCTHMISRSILVRMINFSDKSCR